MLLATESPTFNNMLIEDDLYYKKYEFNGSISASVNIDDISPNGFIHVFPNPFSDYTILKIENINNQ